MHTRPSLLPFVAVLLFLTPPAHAGARFTAGIAAPSLVVSQPTETVSAGTTAPAAVEPSVQPADAGTTAPDPIGGGIEAQPASEGVLTEVGAQGSITAEAVTEQDIAPSPPEDWVYSDWHGEWIRFQESSYQGKYLVRVKVIQTCNSDGTDCSSHIPSDWDRNYWLKRRVLYLANMTFKNSGGLVKFEYEDRDDLEQFLHDDYLNNDCVPNPDVVPEQVTNPDFDPNLICDRTSVVAARNALALQYPGRMVVFPRKNKYQAKYDEDAGHWKITNHLDGYSGEHYIATDITSGNNEDGTISNSNGTVFAHEAGHYLGLPHTFKKQPGTIDAVASLLEAYIEDEGIEDLSDPYVATRIFDADNRTPPAFPVPAIEDTPPDPGRQVYRETFGSPCAGSVLSVPITYEVGSAGQNETILFLPDQQNIMSYFFCGAPHELHYTPDQIARIEYVMVGGKRAHLTQYRDEPPSSCYGNDDESGAPDGSELVTKLERMIDCLHLYDMKDDILPLGTIEQLEFELALAGVELPRTTSMKPTRTTRRTLRTRTSVSAPQPTTVNALAAYWQAQTTDEGLGLAEAAGISTEAIEKGRVEDALSAKSTTRRRSR